MAYVLEASVHLVDEEVRAGRLARADNRRELRRARQRARRVVRQVGHNEPRAAWWFNPPRPQQRLEVGRVEPRPSVAEAARLPVAHLQGGGAPL